MTFGTLAFSYLEKLKPEFSLPENIKFLLPFESREATDTSLKFFNKFYNDSNKRTFVFGINPGRHGAGITGIAFTDPVRLENVCGIKNNFPKKGELSSEFIYRMIENLGGPELFYKNFFLSAVCPVGFIKDGKNINYYDKKLIQRSREFIIKTLKMQLTLGANRDLAICLGEGKNFQYLLKINEEYKFFKEIIPLAHPRYVMQYKRNEINNYFGLYKKALTQAGLSK